ncbi:AAA domain-containing protein [Cytophagales bacterium LB-30]|uniref:DNA helicase n=1 Tax=Shiella aurantiaca TaxID=3058365 RepID=A0ABT8F5L4_9BACT|nr:AAA domain-containing protein [Shiella aurantiaca]MDN4165680.1 AAA domain-containing protein [Shiella aurantiaca]
MTAKEELQHVLQLIKKERQADLQLYKDKVLNTSIERKKQEGICWYPVALKKYYIGMGERLIVEVERGSMQGKSHAFQSGKMVTLFTNQGGKGENPHVGGVINYVRDDQMVITLHEDELPDWIDEGKLGVDVMFDEASYREMESALHELIKTSSGRSHELVQILLGHQPAQFIPHPPLQIGRLNESQNAALNKVLSAQDVAILHGPPGTGKTTTLVQAILMTLKTEKQVLVAAPSNAAVDLLTEKLSEEGLMVVRIGHPARVTEASLSKTLDARIAHHANFKDLRAIRKKSEELRSMAHKYKRHFGRAEREQRQLLMQEAKSLKAEADHLEYYIINDLLEKADAITCTLVGANHYVLKGRQFLTVFIDEAAQSLEPACWIPIMKSHRVVFAGDHQQLPPTVKSVEAEREGLATTLFEKCIQRQSNTHHMLLTQYRMHEVIMHFSSERFYQNSLIAHPTVAQHRLAPEEAPLQFIDTAGCGFMEEQDAETLSRFNTEEAHWLLVAVNRMLERLPAEVCETFSMGIIAPYKAQVLLLRKKMSDYPYLIAMGERLSIDTVDAFQGQERDCIAMSLVRSNEKAEIGFLADIRRTNVAMTRARKKLIIMGDSTTLGSHPFYSDLLDYVQSQEAYQSAYEIMYSE